MSQRMLEAEVSNLLRDAIDCTIKVAVQSLHSCAFCFHKCICRLSQDAVQEVPY